MTFEFNFYGGAAVKKLKIANNLSKWIGFLDPKNMGIDIRIALIRASLTKL